MYAIIKTGGKQYRVSEGDVLQVEKLNAEEGEEITLDQVLLIADGENVTVGKPLIEGSKVQAKVRENGRGKKIKILKFKRRQNYLRKQGHRQDYTELEITGISA